MAPCGDFTFRPVHIIAANKHRQLDPTIRDFLDRVEENSPVALKEFVGCPPDTKSCLSVERREATHASWRYVHPAGLQGTKNPFVFYVCRNQPDGTGNWETHGLAALKFAEVTQSVLIFVEIQTDAASREGVTSLRAILDILHHEAAYFDVDPENWVMVTDGDSSPMVIDCLSTITNAPIPRPTRLVLLTPVIAAAHHDDARYCLTSPGSAKLAREFNPSLQQLRLLPPTLIILAGVDPFRPAAEAFVQRLVTAEIETTAACFLGAIHDFCWLAPVMEGPVTAAAHRMITGEIFAAFTTATTTDAQHPLPNRFPKTRQSLPDGG